MGETYYAGAYWKARRESPEECGLRAEAFFTAIRELDPCWVHWFKQANTFKDALKHPIEPDQTTLAKMFKRGKDRIFEDLGFRISGWNGVSEDLDATSFYIKCGGWSEGGHNMCTFQPPSRGANADRVLTATVLAGLVRSMAIAWEPDWAIATSSDHRELVTTKATLGTFVGWVMYHANHRGRVPPLPAPVQIERVEQQGTLITLTPERFTVSNPEHVTLAARVQELLGRAGLLAPVVPDR